MCSSTVPIAAYPLFCTADKSPLQISYRDPILQLKKIHFDDSSDWGMNMVAHYKLSFCKPSSHDCPVSLIEQNKVYASLTS